MIASFNFSSLPLCHRSQLSPPSKTGSLFQLLVVLVDIQRVVSLALSPDSRRTGRYTVACNGTVKVEKVEGEKK